MAAYRKRISNVTYKEEAAEGTAETASLLTDVRVIDPTFTPQMDQFERNIVADTFGGFSSLSGCKSGRLQFTQLVCGGGTSSTTPPEGKFLLRACGMQETIAANVIYRPETTVGATMKSLTFRFNIDGKYWAIRGARGNMRVSGEVGQPLRREFDFLGVFDHEEVDAAIPTASHSVIIPPRFLAATLTINSVSLKVRSFSVDLGNVLTLRPNVNNIDGYTSTVITNKMATGTVEIEPEVVGTHDVFSLAEDMTEMELSLSVGTGPGEVLTMTAPKLQYTGAGITDVNGLSMYSIPFKLNRSTGDDEYVETWT